MYDFGNNNFGNNFGSSFDSSFGNKKNDDGFSFGSNNIGSDIFNNDYRFNSDPIGR